MIFLTVGTQLPFDRLVSAVDHWAGDTGQDVVGQIGPSTYTPRNMTFRQFYDQAEVDSLVAGATVIISHAGMGSILTALTSAKPIIIVPRKAELGEHRNDHQLATARKFADLPSVRTVLDVNDLEAAYSALLRLRASAPISQFASPRLLAALKQIIDAT